VKCNEERSKRFSKFITPRSNPDLPIYYVLLLVATFKAGSCFTRVLCEKYKSTNISHQDVFTEVRREPFRLIFPRGQVAASSAHNKTPVKML